VTIGIDSLRTRRTLEVAGKSYEYFSLPALEAAGHPNIKRLPYSLKVLLENLLRHEDGEIVKASDICAFSDWVKTRSS
jgi:aconitate hydratase